MSLTAVKPHLTHTICDGQQKIHYQYICLMYFEQNKVLLLLFNYSINSGFDNVVNSS